MVAAQDVTGAVTELVTPVGDLTDTGTIAFTDVDLTDVHNVSGSYASARALGTLTAREGRDTTGTGLGGVLTWNYTVARPPWSTWRRPDQGRDLHRHARRRTAACTAPST